MLFSSVAQLSKRKEADLIVLPFWQSSKKAKEAAQLESFASYVSHPLLTGDFKGKKGESILLYIDGEKEKRLLLLGLGDEGKLSIDHLRYAYSNVAKLCQKKSISKINIVVPNIADLRNIDLKGCLRGITEGILINNYHFSKSTDEEEKVVLLEHVTLVGVAPKFLSSVISCEDVAEGLYFARDLINGNADLITPHYLGEVAKKIAGKFSNVTVEVHDRKWIEKEKMGLFAAVARSSFHEPVFIVLKYRGNPKSKDNTVLVGKGITYDTGGLNLKPTGSMETMRCDMSGAAAVLSTIAVAASLGIKHNIVAVVAATENAIDAKSYKPGDVYAGMSGKTVEVCNTDAEGRLTLADALTYSVTKLEPTRVIDLATLTGAMVVALGEEVAGFFCNNDKLADQLMDASIRTSEGIWRMPLHAPYKEYLKSDIADMRNTGPRFAGSITAALFLQEFVNDVPWAHIDIAGPAFMSKEFGYQPKNAVGFGVRLLVDFFQNLSQSSDVSEK